MLVSVISIMIPYLYTFINGHWASPVAQRHEVLRSTLFSLLWLNNYAESLLLQLIMCLLVFLRLKCFLGDLRDWIMNVPWLGGTWSCIAGSGPCLSSQKLPCAPETSTGAGSARILVPERAPESWLCLCQLWDPGPGTHPRSHLSPCKWRQGQYHPPRTAALTACRS